MPNTSLVQIQNENNKYYSNIIEKAVTDHLNNYSDFPLNFRIGDSRHITINTASLRCLNSVFEKYKDKLYDENKTILNFENNPNIIIVKNSNTDNLPETIKKNNYHDLNSILVTDALNILADFHTFDKDAYIVYNPKTFNKNELTGTTYFELVESTGVNTENEPFLKRKLQDGYVLLNEFPLRKNLSRDLNYFSFVESLKNKNILNPNIKFFYNPKKCVFSKLPREWTKFEDTFKRKTPEPNNVQKKKEKNISSSLSRRGR